MVNKVWIGVHRNSSTRSRSPPRSSTQPSRSPGWSSTKSTRSVGRSSTRSSSLSPRRTPERSLFCPTEFPEQSSSLVTLCPGSKSPEAQSIQSSNCVHPPSVRCLYPIEWGLEPGLECFNETLSDDYCSDDGALYRSSTGSVTSEAALSKCASRPKHDRSRCQAMTLKRLPCSFRSLLDERFCKRHLNYVGAEAGGMALPIHDPVPIPFHPAPQQVQEIAPQQPQGIADFAEAEALDPICRHCKLQTLRQCDLCESHGCKRRILSVVHEAIDLGHSMSTPPDAASTSSRRSARLLPTRAINRRLTATEILPKLKMLACPKDFGMPPTIPICTNFFVWDRWWHVKQSLLGPDVGLGLFTVHPIPKGQDLFPYIGPHYDTETYRQIEQAFPEIRVYAMSYKDDEFADHPNGEVWIDGAPRHSNLAGYINCPPSSSSRKTKANVAWELKENYPSSKMPGDMINFIATVSTRPIAAGEELLALYDWQGALNFVRQSRAGQPPPRRQRRSKTPSGRRKRPRSETPPHNRKRPLSETPSGRRQYPRHARQKYTSTPPARQKWPRNATLPAGQKYPRNFWFAPVE